MDVVDHFAISVRGPWHVQRQCPNEDAWLAVEGRFGAMVVVADGLGSCPRARFGAQAACRAVRDAVRRWDRAERRCDGQLPSMVAEAWASRIAGLDPSDCATTCLFAIRHRSGTWLAGGLGDGLVAVRTGEDPPCVVIGDRGAGFANETVALGAGWSPNDWHVIVLPPTRRRRTVLLASDGVSDDLVQEHLGEFMSWLLKRFSPLSPRVRAGKLRAELNAWPTPGHSDDKTIAVLWEPGRLR